MVRRDLLIDLYDYDDAEEDRGGPSTVSWPGEPAAGKQEGMTDIATDSVGSAATTDDRARIIDQSGRTAAKADWRRLAVVLDRFFLVLFAAVMIVTCLAFTGYL